MKKQYILILIAMLVLALIISIAKPKTINKVDYVDNEAIEELVISDSYELRVIDLSDEYIKFEVKYPYFKNAPDVFNENIFKLLNNEVSNSKKLAKENWMARYNTKLPDENISEIPSSDDKFSFYSDFTIAQSNSNYISLVLNYGGFLGGAHGYEINVSFNYDLKNGKFLSIKDLFLNDEEYLSYLSSESRKYLMSQYVNTSTYNQNDLNSDGSFNEYNQSLISSINQGTEPKEENFSVFTFTPDKIKIYFADYQVGPHSIGMPEVEIDRK